MTKQALKQKISSSLWLLFSAIFISLFSTELLANSENQSLDPNTYLIAAVLGHCDNKTSTNNNFIESTIGIERSANTSTEACANSVKFALEKGASADLLLEFVTYYSELVGQKDLLTKIALEKGAKERPLEQGVFSSKELYDGLLKLKKLPPDALLSILINADKNDNSTIPSSDFVTKRSELMDLTFKYGAKLEKLPYPSAAEAIRNKGPFVSFDQGLIMKKLDLLLEKSIPPKEAKKNSVNKLKEEIKKQKGFCMGLSTMWLYSKWLQFTHPEKTGEYSNDWFITTIQDLSLSDDKQVCDSDNNFYKFASLMGFFQGVEVENKQNDDNDFMQSEVDKRLLLSKLDTDGKTLKKKYSIETTFNVDQLEKLLSQAVHEHEWVFIFPNNTHALGIFKHGKDYYYYDSNNNAGEYKTTSIKEIAEQISQTALQMQMIDNNLRSNNEIKIGISIFSLDNQENSYPDKKETLIESNKTLNVETAFELAQDSIQTDSFESFKFYLDKAIELNGGKMLDNNTTLEKKEPAFKTIAFVTENNNSNFTQEILNKGIDPNQILIINHLPELENSNDPEAIKGLKNLKAGVTMLSGAADGGNVEAIKVLLNDKRTDINLASGFDKETPLMFAVEENKPEAVKLLLARGADPNLKDKHGNDARTLAELYGCQECIAILNEHQNNK